MILLIVCIHVLRVGIEPTHLVYIRHLPLPLGHRRWVPRNVLNALLQFTRLVHHLNASRAWVSRDLNSEFSSKNRKFYQLILLTLACAESDSNRQSHFLKGRGFAQLYYRRADVVGIEPTGTNCSRKRFGNERRCSGNAAKALHGR